jgi:HAD superfamily hydrolase (TIGR01509 family)
MARHPGAGVVFDCDGVLADTNQCWDNAFTVVARDFGLTLSEERLSALHGAALGTAARQLARWSSRLVRAEQVQDALTKQLVSAIGATDLVLPAGAGDLLGQLHGRVPVGVASNSPRPVLLRVLARLDITAHFAVVVSADDVPRPKPAPDPYLAACAALGIDPRGSFAVEDSEAGISSAVAAGLAVIEVGGAASPASRPGRALRVATLADPRIGPLVLGRADGWNQVRDIQVY